MRECIIKEGSTPRVNLGSDSYFGCTVSMRKEQVYGVFNAT